MTTHTVEWYDPVKDPAVAQLAAALKQRAQWGQPDVMIEPAELLPEIAELVPLFQQRIAHRAQAATRAAAADVEPVVTGAKITQTDGFHVPTAGPADLEETRASRAHAERLALARRVLAGRRAGTDRQRRSPSRCRRPPQGSDRRHAPPAT